MHGARYTVKHPPTPEATEDREDRENTMKVSADLSALQRRANLRWIREISRIKRIKDRLSQPPSPQASVFAEATPARMAGKQRLEGKAGKPTTKRDRIS